MKRSLWLLIVCIIIASSAVAQRDKDPTAMEIAGRLAAIKLDTSLSVRAEQGAKRVQVTPVVAASIDGSKDLEEGRIIGVLDAQGNVDNVPNGKHNIFVTKVNDVWHAYAESGGKIVAKSKRVTVESADDVRKPEIEFNLKITLHVGKVKITLWW